MIRQKFILTENSINGVKLNDKIREDELHEFSIVHRESIIDELISLISSSNDNNELVKLDLKELMNWNCDYILSSNRTNCYIGVDSCDYNEICTGLLKLNENL